MKGSADHIACHGAMCGLNQPAWQATELKQIIKALQTEVEQLRSYTTALEAACTNAGVELADVKAVAAASSSASDPTFGGAGRGGGGGGGDPVMEAALRAEAQKAKEMLRIAQDEAAEAVKECEEARQSAEQAMKEGAAAKLEMEKMSAKRSETAPLCI